MWLWVHVGYEACRQQRVVWEQLQSCRLRFDSRITHTREAGHSWHWLDVLCSFNHNAVDTETSQAHQSLFS